MKITNKSIGRIKFNYVSDQIEGNLLTSVVLRWENNDAGIYNMIRLIILWDVSQEKFCISDGFYHLSGESTPISFKEQHQTIVLPRGLQLQLELFYIDGDIHTNLYDMHIDGSKNKVLDSCLFLNKMEIAMIEYLRNERHPDENAK